MPKNQTAAQRRANETKSQFELRTEREALISSLPTRSPIYLPTEKIDLESQVVGLRQVSEIYADMEEVYGPKLRELRDKYKGVDRAFIIGNGPSLNETDLSQLRDEVTFCVNGFFLKLPELDWTPTFYVVEDHLVAEDRSEPINALKGPTKLFPAYLGYCLDRADDTIFYNHRPRKSYPDGFDFSTEADKITYTGCTVTMSCMQLAHYMGFRELYLIGVDASYEIPEDVETSEDYSTGVIDMQSDDTNHFHPDYFGKGFRWHDPQVNMMVSAYEEAERVTNRLGRPIYNATIGGMLEVFERRNFNEIFPDAIPAEVFRDIDPELTPDQRSTHVKKLVKSHRRKVSRSSKAEFPKIAVIDMTRMGNATATGELKKTLFDGYPNSRLLEVFSIGNQIGVNSKYLPGADGTQKIFEVQNALDWVLDFDPDVILFRPAPEQPILTELAELAYQHTGARFVTWIMDSWQDRLLEKSPKLGQAADDLLQDWFSRSAHCLAISEPMAAAFSKRYNANFTPVANGVDPKDWDMPRRDAKGPKEPFVLRYSGGLAPDMSLQTLKNISKAVDKLAAETPIQFEINTRQHWIREQGRAFDAFKNTNLSCVEMPITEYRQWIMDGDACLIAYNFDEKSQIYVKHSLANKLPECLASGSPLIAVGPVGIATIDFLNKFSLGKVVVKDNVDAIYRSLREICQSPELQKELSNTGRDFAFEQKSVRTARSSLYQVLRTAAVETERKFEAISSNRKLRYIHELENANKPRKASILAAVTRPKATGEKSAVWQAPSIVTEPKAAGETLRVWQSPDLVTEPKVASGTRLVSESGALLTEPTSPMQASARIMPSVRDASVKGSSKKSQMRSVNRRRRSLFRFYAGPKGLLAFILVGIAALPAVPLTGWMATAAKFGPAFSIAALLLLVGRWVVQLTDAVEGP